jgi:hypothetical protein
VGLLHRGLAEAGAALPMARQRSRSVKWILATGIAVAIAAILYAWYRGGEGAAATLGLT